MEVYEGALFEEEIVSRNWCEDAHLGKLDGTIVKEKNSNAYRLSYQLKENESLTITLAEDLGMRYALEIAPELRLKISSLKSYQIGPKNYYYIQWKKPFSGPFDVQLVSHSWLEKNLGFILKAQLTLIAFTIAFIVFGWIRLRKKEQP